jgi:DNA polymerase III subunit delta'
VNTVVRTASGDVPAAIAAATADQPAARLALAAALIAPSHAYLLTGPPGSGKRDAARGLAAELLADGAPDPAGARRRVLADPSPHPDLAWLRPPGAQHLVDEVRKRVISAAAFRPFEGARRVFVIEAAEAMADESQNALLKTLEEPAPFAHLILVSSEPEALLETVRSRCQPVRFARLPPEVLEARLASRASDAAEIERRAAARLAGGDAGRALLLLGEEGRALREGAIAWVAATRKGEDAAAHRGRLLDAADGAGERATEEARAAAEALTAEAGEGGSAGARRREREAADAARRAGRRARTETLDLGLALIAAWMRDLAAVADGAPELALNADRSQRLAADATGTDALRARRGAELAMDTRRRLRVNVSEELALEALSFRLGELLEA